jgi:hypothetical protein
MFTSVLKLKLRGLSSRANYIDRAIDSFVGEVSANFCGKRVPRGLRDGSLGRILGFLDR